MPDGNPGRAYQRADEEIDAFIAKRHAERERIEAEAEAERVRGESYLHHRDGGHLEEWRDYYLDLASTLEALADENRERAARLMARERGSFGIFGP